MRCSRTCVFGFNQIDGHEFQCDVLVHVYLALIRLMAMSFNAMFSYMCIWL